MKLLSLSFVYGFLLLSSTCLKPVLSDFGDDGVCDVKCNARCAKAGVQDRCLKYCGICCAECHCVPSGTFGNKEECPCYMNKMNSKGKPKCP